LQGLFDVWDMAQIEELRAQLIEKAQSRGSITYDDILALLPEVERDVVLLDDIMDGLLEAGIDVIPSHGAQEGAAEGTPHTRVEMDMPEEEDEDLSFAWFDDDLVEDAGYQQALDTDDVVGLYLKEAGRVPLLTAEEEVALAKRMEAGVWAKDRLDTMTDQLPMDDVYTLRDLVYDGEQAQEHLVRANARLVISVAKKYIGRGVHFLD
jgi:RNA polymerase primary sigma factor